MATGIKATNAYHVFILRDDEGKAAFDADMLDELLGAHAATDISVTQHAYVDFSHGVCDIRNGGQFGNTSGSHPALDNQFENLLIFGYRFDRRNPPADAVQKEVDVIVAARKAENNGEYEMTKANYKEILQEAKSRCLPRTPVRSKVATVMYDTNTGVLLIGGASDKEADIITGLMLRYAAIHAIPVNPVEAAAILNQEYLAAMAALEPQVAQEGAGDCLLISDLALWLWRVSEIAVGSDNTEVTFEAINSKRLATCGLNGDTLVVGDINGEGKTDEPVASKEHDHAHIRYALWKDAKSITAATFQLVVDLGTAGLQASIGLKAQTPNILRIGIVSPAEIKVLTKRYVPPKRFCGVAASKDDQLIHEYNMLMGHHEDEQAAALALYTGSVFASLYAFLGMSGMFLQARAVPVRWKQEKDMCNEWLMGYVPECERDEFIKNNTALQA